MDLESYKFMYTDIMYIRTIMINNRYNVTASLPESAIKAIWAETDCTHHANRKTKKIIFYGVEEVNTKN